MEIPFENFKIVGLLSYLDYPDYLKKIYIICVNDIFDKMEEKIEEFAIQIDELEKYYKLIKNENDKKIILNKIKNKKKKIKEMKNQLKFIKI
jgi:hypothetical protein